MIEIRCVHALADAAPFRDAMNALNLASARPDPFSTFEFYDSYLRNAGFFAPGPDLRLWLLLAFSDGELVGYLPLKQRTGRVLGLRAGWIDLLTAHVADRPHLVAPRGLEQTVGAAMYAYLLSRKDEWSLLEFEQQDAASPLLPPPTALGSGGCRLQRWPNLANGTIPMRWPSLAAYFADLPHKSRSNVSRQMRSLFAAGDVQLLESSDPATLAPLFELYRVVEQHSWKSHGDAAFGAGGKWIDHYRGLMAGGQPMRLAIQLILLDDVPIAGLITGAFDKGLYALHIVHDERRDLLAPGSAMMLMGVRRAIEGRYEFFDLLRGFGYYKARWLAQMSETASLQIYRAGTPFYWRRTLGNLRRRWLGPVSSGAATLWNPARRALRQPQPAPSAVASLQERAQCAGLLARVRAGRGDFLSAAQLAAALPFPTRGEAPAPHEKARPRGLPHERALRNRTLGPHQHWSGGEGQESRPQSSGSPPE